jgi:hypothetical protein
MDSNSLKTHLPISRENCEWFDDGCNIGHHGGNPTPQNCAECMDFRGPSRGLGDKAAKVISTLRLDTLRKKKTEVDGGCGCGKRRAALNKRFPSKDRT